MGSVNYTNIGAGTTREITIDWELFAISYVETGGTGFGACTTSKTQFNGGYEGEAVLTGTVEGAHIGIWYA